MRPRNHVRIPLMLFINGDDNEVEYCLGLWSACVVWFDCGDFLKFERMTRAFHRTREIPYISWLAPRKNDPERLLTARPLRDSTTAMVECQWTWSRPRRTENEVEIGRKRPRYQEFFIHVLPRLDLITFPISNHCSRYYWLNTLGKTYSTLARLATDTIFF